MRGIVSNRFGTSPHTISNDYFDYFDFVRKYALENSKTLRFILNLRPNFKSLNFLLNGPQR